MSKSIGDWVAALFGLTVLLSLFAAIGCSFAIRFVTDPESCRVGLPASLASLHLGMWALLVSCLVDRR